MDTIATPALRNAIVRMAQEASIEVSVKSPSVVADCVQWLPRGSQVFISMVPGQTYHQTAQLAGGLAKAGFVPVPHVTARNIVNQAMAQDIFARFGAAGVERVLLLGGDRDVPVGPYDSALALMQPEVLAVALPKRIYVSGYPDGHPRIPATVLAEQLDLKLACCKELGIASGVVTQFTFDESALIGWLDRIGQRHPGVALMAGAAGPAGAGTLLRYAARCGVRASMSMLTRHAEKLMRVLSEAGPEALIHALAQREVATGRSTGLHLFSFGGTARTARWRSAVADGHFDLDQGEATFEVRPR